MDETGWRTAGERRALWGIFQQDRHTQCFRSHAVVTRITPRRCSAQPRAIVTSDRWWAYAHLPLRRRQVCWSHLQRDFAAHAEGLAAEKEFGEHGLQICEHLFWAWEVYQHTSDRRELRLAVRALRRQN